MGPSPWPIPASKGLLVAIARVADLRPPSDLTLGPPRLARRLKKTLGQKRARAAPRADDDTDESDDESDELGDWTAIGWLGVKYTKRIVLPDFACVSSLTAWEARFRAFLPAHGLASSRSPKTSIRAAALVHSVSRPRRGRRTSEPGSRSPRPSTPSPRPSSRSRPRRTPTSRRR